MHRFAVVLLAVVACAYGARASPSDRIVGGSDAGFWSTPYQVSIQTLRDGHICGGSIINRRWILTAAQCIKSRHEILPGTLRVVVGSNSLKRGLTYRARNVIVHPDWNRLTKRNDIALIQIRTILIYTSRIQPISLPTEDFTEVDYPAVLTGWGIDGFGGELHDTLQRITVNVISQTSCLLTVIGTTRSNICTATVRGETGGCDGDYGSPLVAEGVQIGILSSTSIICASGRPDVHTRVWNYVDWINDTINGNEESEE